MKRKEYKEEMYKLDFSGYFLYRTMIMLHDEVTNLDVETQEKLNEFILYLGNKYEPNIENDYNLEDEELYVKYYLSK